jgi:hypothetical protein
MFVHMYKNHGRCHHKKKKHITNLHKRADPSDRISLYLAQFHERFISLDPAFGLRTIPSIQRIADDNGWRLVERKGMMSGNWMIFFERSI